VIEADDLELFETSVRRATETHTGTALDAALAELGWHDALAVDAPAAVAIHFHLQGRNNATSSALDHVVALALGVDAPVAVVLPALGRWAPPAAQQARGAAVVDGLGGASFAAHATALLVAESEGKEVVSTVSVTDLTTTPVQGLDPGLGLVQVRGTVALAEPAPADWSAAVDLARLALSHELVGASRTMLDLARTHAVERIQFGQPIAAFQAVRHRLAETSVAIEAAQAVLDAAWLDRGPTTAAIAKAVAGRSARTSARHCQQVLAGIGFTTEHSFHRFVRRVLVLDEMFGASRTLTKALGGEILASRRLPSLLPL
jgi:hypothetical protein